MRPPEAQFCHPFPVSSTIGSYLEPQLTTSTETIDGTGKDALKFIHAHYVLITV